MIQALRILRDRNDVLALVSILLAVQFFPKDVPAGIQALGVVGGSFLALHALGIVLVYRSNRIINFAQIQVGMVAATLFTVLVRFQPLVRLVQNVCPPCIDRPLDEIRPGAELFVVDGVYKANYYAALVISFAFAALLGWAVYTLIVKRFAEAPRLVLTVATIFIAQLLAGVQVLIPRLLTTELQREAGLQLTPPPIPFRFSFRWDPATFNATEILLVSVFVLALVGVTWYFRVSTTGVAIRASADNPPRVATLGINVHSVTKRVWIIAALLSAAVAILQAMAVGTPGGTGLSVAVLVRILAVAVIARFASLPMTALTALVFGILDQGVLWSFGTVVALDGLMLFIIGGILVLQRFKLSRAELEQASAWRAAREVRGVPRELAGLASVRRWRRWIGVVIGVVVLGAPWIASPAQASLLGVGLVFAMVILSLLVLNGWAGQVSLGQFAFAAVGGYIAGIWSAPFPIVLVAAGVCGAVAAVVVGLPALKMRGLHLAITTMALALTATSLLLNTRYLGRHLPSRLDSPSLVGMELDDQRVFYYFALVVLAGMVAAVLGLRRSRTARALIACRDNDLAAQSFGINLVRTRLVAFAFSGFLAAVAGALYAYQAHSVRVQAFAPEVSVTLFLFGVIGGLGSLTGALIGGAIYTLFLLFQSTPLIYALGSGLGGLVILYLEPGGVGQIVFNVRDAILRRVASRHRIIVPSLLADVRQTGEQRAAIAAKVRPGGGTAFVPERYRLGDQWLIESANGSQPKEPARG